MSKNINDLPELSSATPSAFAHVFSGGKDYKMPISALTTGASTYAGQATQQSAGVYAVTTAAPETEYVQNRIYWFKFDAVSESTGYTVNIDSLGAKSLKKFAAGGNVDIYIGDLVAGPFIPFIYDGTNFVLNDCSETKIFTVSKTFTKATIETMDWAGKRNLVSAPGAGYAIQLLEPVFALNWVSGNAAWSLGGAAGEFTINQPSHGSSTGMYGIGTAVYTAAAAKRRPMAQNTDADIYANEGYDCFFKTAAPVSGDASITVYAAYRIFKV
jgi:hypothetical protein